MKFGGSPERGSAVFSTTVFLLAAAAGVALSASVASGPPILARRWVLLGALGLWSLAWLLSVATAFRLPRGKALSLVVTAAIALRLAALAGPPTTSDDLYRYSWDGRVQAAGVNAYAEPPASPALAGLREPWLWPEPRECADLGRPAGCSRINRPAVRTIYPPVAEAWFAAVYRLAGIDARHKAWQISGLLTELVTLALLGAALRRRGRDVRWLALYGLCPAPVLEIVNNGHVDGLAVAFILAAFTVTAEPTVGAGAGRLTGAQRDLAAGVLLGIATLVKLYPAALVVALAGRGRESRVAVLARAGGAAAAVVTLAYLPHVLAVEGRVAGYLPDYLREEDYGAGGRFLVAAAFGIPRWWAGPVSVLAVLAVAGWVLWRRPPVPTGGAVVVGTLLLAASPVQPWYALSLLALAAVAARPVWAAVVAAGYPYFFAVILDSRHSVGLGQLCYAVALALVVIDSLRRWRIARRVSVSIADVSPPRQSERLSWADGETRQRDPAGTPVGRNQRARRELGHDDACGGTSDHGALRDT